MPEILPNWHPAAVHFPIALALTATLLLLAGRLLPAHAGLPAAARLLLPLAAISALISTGLGWHAYQTVEHDAAGHLVMLRHRNWAMACTAGLLLIAIWDSLRQRAGRPLHGGILPVMLLLCGGLTWTGWLGGEMVYRHGIGVLPSAFASPEIAAEPLPVIQPATVVEAPVKVDTPHVHIHQDGKRHRH
jgi:uncharacterized membrane protein